MPLTELPFPKGTMQGLGRNPCQPTIVEAMQNGEADQSRSFDFGTVLAENKLWSPWVSDIKDTHKRANTALMLEVTKRWIENAQLDETTRMFHVGNFDKFAFPLVRAVFPNLIANDIVSVQPMAGPVSLIFYLDFLYGSNKGQVAAGTSAFDAITGPNANKFYTHDIVDREAPATFVGSGSSENYSFTLAYTPIRPGSVHVHTVDGTVNGYDNGNGTVSGTGLTGTNTIDYTTGEMVVTTTNNLLSNGEQGYVTYEYNSEASDLIPQMDVQLTSAAVTARSRKLRARWSLEAAQNLNALHSIDAEAELIGVMAEELKFELDREIIDDLWAIAPGDTTFAAGLGQESTNTIVFDRNVPSGTTWVEYKLTFVDHLIEASNKIFRRTRRGAANFIVGDVNTLNIIQALPTFDADPGMAQGVGVVFAGTLNKQWKVYKDPYLRSFVTTHGSDNLSSGLSGFDVVGTYLLGFKGNSFLDAGFVYAPYIPIYSTPTVVLDDFLGRKGMATQYGKRKVNENYYVRGYTVL